MKHQKKYVTELLKYEEHQLLLSLERKERNQWYSNGIFHPILYKKSCKLAWKIAKNCLLLFSHVNLDGHIFSGKRPPGSHLLIADFNSSGDLIRENISK